MEFSNEFLGNNVYQDQPLMFNPLLKEKIGGLGSKIEIDTGAFVQTNGDILFRIYAPGSREVIVKERGQGSRQWTLKLDKNADGIFEGTQPYDPEYCGPHSLDISFDGTVLIYPYIPIFWTRNKPVNFIEIPDPETDYIQIRDVPHGAIAREIYWSAAMNKWLRCLVYTPPGYQKGTEEYPVLYLQHGATENETSWEYNGRVGYIMDNLIAEGKCVPFIVVMNDGMISKDGDGVDSNNPEKARTFKTFEDSLLNSCVPYIEKTYRVKTDKWSRAIAGLSMGSAQSLLFGITHPEYFCAVGMFSGTMTRQPSSLPQYELVKDPAYMEKNYKLFFKSMGDAEGSIDIFRQETEVCKETGTAALPLFEERIYHNQTHEFGAWRRSLHDMAQLLFRW